jgi:Cu2+-exporting ATPase
MDVPISIGVLLATGMSLAETVNGGEHAYFDSACALLFFLLVGRFLDARARGRARAAAGHLAGLQARAVTRLRQADGLPEAVAPEAIAVGDRVLVTAGERIPVDGTVDGGRAMIDTSLVTGEAAPTSAGAGDRVFAGMMALDAPLTVRVDACGSATLLADIARMMEDAEQGRARYAALADRVARWYAPVVHCLALATLLVWMLMLDASWTTALPIAIAVLIITCPCALALAVPVVQVVASGRLFRAGVLLRSPTALERLADVDTIILDKTGTLTLGRPAPDLADLDPDDRAIAAGLAGASRHPLARALAAALPGAGPRLEAREVAGEGMETCEDDPVRLGRRSFCRVPEDPAVAEPELWLARPGRRARRIPFGDPLRADARATVERLRHLGLGVGLLSGDHAGAVGAVAAAVGIDRVRAEARPADKVASIRKLAGEGRRVLMVGDGLNDAPALAAAHVSLSPAAAADISRNAADAVFQGDALAPVAMVVDVARRARVLVRQNLALALAYNLVAVPLAMAGLVTPLLAAAAMSTSSILVIVNALRLGSVR